MASLVGELLPWFLALAVLDAFVLWPFAPFVFVAPLGRAMRRRSGPVVAAWPLPTSDAFLPWGLPLFAGDDALYVPPAKRAGRRRWAPPGELRAIAREGEPFAADGREIRRVGVVVIEAPSKESARLAAEALEAWRRRGAASEVLARPFDAEAFRAVRERVRVETRFLPALGTALLAVFFLALPASLTARSLLLLDAGLVAVLLLWVAIVALSRRALVRLEVGAPGRREALLPMLFFPLAGLRARALIAREVEPAFDPALGALLLPSDEGLDLLRGEAAALRALAREADDPELRAAVTRRLDRVRGLGKAIGASRESIDAPRPRRDPASPFGCPLCGTEYVESRPCDDCGVTLDALAGG